MNNFMKIQIQTMITTTKTFQQACKMAALEDDGKIDKIEAKQLKQINAASEKFMKELQKIK